MQIPATLPDLIAATAALLRDGRPRSEQEIAEALQEQGLDLGVRPEDTIKGVLYDEEIPFVVSLGDGRHARLDALLEDRIFTHRLGETEVALGYLDASPDLDALSIFFDQPEYGRLVDGGTVTSVLPGFDDELLADRGIPVDATSSIEVLLLERDLLRRKGFSAGDLVGVALRPDGLELTAVAAVEPAPDMSTRLTRTLAALGDGEAVELADLVWQLCGDDPALFTTPLPPLTELLADAGLVVEGEWVGPAGFDFQAWRLDKRIGVVCGLYDLDEDEGVAVLGIRELVGSHDDAPLDLELLRALLDFLVDPAVAHAVFMETAGTGAEGAAALGAFAESVEPAAPRRARAALRWLRGKALDRSGNALAAEQAYESALELAEFPLALFDLARVAGDRGDAERGLSLLRRAGAPEDDPLVLLLEHFRPAERRDIPRNAPCWCGSGRKYKVCHRNREQLPLAERAAWLYQKAGLYLSEGAWPREIVRIAQIRAEHLDVPDPVEAAMQDPLLIDAVLFEGGAFAAFLAERGVLLPDDERLLGEQWMLAERSVWEIEEVTPGSGFRVRDLRTGDRVEVRERTASRTASQGMLVCARFVPAGDTVQCFGGMEIVPLEFRDPLLKLLDSEPEPEELVEFLSARFRPPDLQNTEGDPLVFCEATLRSPDPGALAAALDATYDRDPTGAVWREHVTTLGVDRIRATIELDGDQVKVETNSEARQDRVLAALRSVQPGIEVVQETRVPAHDMQEAMSRAPAGARESSSLLDSNDPRVAAALDEFVRQHERAWLDEHIPALAGLTPREAAADPTRRPDLIRLLDSFPPGGSGQMDPARLRAELGL